MNYKDQKGNIHIPYMGGEIILRAEGSFVNDDGKEIRLNEAIKIQKGAIASQLPFEAFASLVAEAYVLEDVKIFLEKNGVHIKKGLL